MNGLHFQSHHYLDGDEYVQAYRDRDAIDYSSTVDFIYSPIGCNLLEFKDF